MPLASGMIMNGLQLTGHATTSLENGHARMRLESLEELLAMTVTVTDRMDAAL